MPRYYFDICSSGRMDDRDDIGQDLRDQYAAWEMATRYAGESLRDLDGGLRFDTDWRLEVRAQNGTCIFQITVRATQS
jgi:hypothetical protein